MKRALSLILAVLMIASVMVLPTFAEEGTKAYALNNLEDFGQRVVELYDEKTPTMDGTVNASEYSGSYSLAQVNNGTYADIGAYKLYVSQDANKIYFGLTFDENRKTGAVPIASGAGVGGGNVSGTFTPEVNCSAMALYINFPSEFLAKDANNYLIIYLNMISNTHWPLVAVKAVGEETFVKNIQTKLNEYAVKGNAADTSFDLGDVMYPDDQTTFPYTYKYNTYIPTGRLLKMSGVMPDTPVGAKTDGAKTGSVANYEFSLSKAAMMDIFGWNGMTDMTVMSWVKCANANGSNSNWGTQMADEGTHSTKGYKHVYGNAKGAAALEAYSAAKGDNTPVAPWVTSAANAAGGTVNGRMTQARNIDDVIPDIVRFTKPLALNDLAGYGQDQIDATVAKTPTIDGVVNATEYSGNFNHYGINRSGEANKSLHTIYAAQDADNLYFAVTADETLRKGGQTGPVQGTAMDDQSGIRLYLNFPSKFSAKDANNYLVLTINYDTTFSTPLAGLSVTGDAEFIAEMQAKLGSANVSTAQNPTNMGAFLVKSGIIRAYECSATDGALTGSVANYELALSKAALSYVFGWNGKTDVAFMVAVEYSKNQQGFMSDEYKNTDAVAALEAYSKLLGDDTTVAPCIREYWNWTATPAIPDILKVGNDSVAKPTLKNLAVNTVNANFAAPKFDSAISAGEYTGSYTLPYAGTWCPYTVSASHNIGNINLAVNCDESQNAANIYPTLNTAIRFFINFPDQFDVEDANNYLIIECKPHKASDKNMSDNFAVAATGSADFIAKLGETFTGIKDVSEGYVPLDLMGMGIVTDYSAVIVDSPSTANPIFNLEIAFSKAAMKDAFAWNGETEMTLMTWYRFGSIGRTAVMANRYARSFAASVMENYYGGTIAPKAYTNITLGALDDLMPTVVSFNELAVKGYMSNKGSMRLSSTDGYSGLRFKTFWDEEWLATQEIAEIGTIIAPKVYVDEASDFTHAALDALGKTNKAYVEAVATEAFAEDGVQATYAGSLVALKSNTREYAARGYVKLANGEYIYADGYTVRSIQVIAVNAANDFETTAGVAGYGNLVTNYEGNDVYSPYSQDHYDMIAKWAGLI